MYRIVLVNAVYPPEPVVSARLGCDLAEWLGGEGHDVTVVCPFPTRPAGADYSTAHVRSHVVEQKDGVPRVVRVPSFTAPRSRLVSRLFESWSFGRHSARYISNLPDKPHSIYANTWPVLAQVLLARQARRLRIPLVLHIQDLYPESLLRKLPFIARAIVGRPLEKMDAWTARQASCLVVISDSMRQTYEHSRKVPPTSIACIPNWQDSRPFERCTLSKEEAKAKHGLEPAHFTFLYLGNIGPVAGVEFLIEAFCKANLPRSELIIAGNGSCVAGCVKLARSLGGESVLFFPHATNAPVIQAMADVCLLPMRQGAAFSSIPSKLVAYQLSAKPVLATIDAESDSARVILQSRGGWIGPPEDVHWLAQMMRTVQALPAHELEAMGERSAAYAREHFARSTWLPRLGGIVLEAAQRGSDGEDRRE